MGKGESKKQYFHDNDQGHCIKRLKNVDYDGEWIEVFFKNMILKFHIFKTLLNRVFPIETALSEARRDDVITATSLILSSGRGASLIVRVESVRVATPALVFPQLLIT